MVKKRVKKKSSDFFTTSADKKSDTAEHDVVSVASDAPVLDDDDDDDDLIQEEDGAEEEEESSPSVLPKPTVQSTPMKKGSTVHHHHHHSSSTHHRRPSEPGVPLESSNDTGKGGDPGDKGPVFDPSKFYPYHWRVYYENKGQVKTEILAGLTVAFAQIPESIAFAFLAGVPPDVGLQATWIVNFICSTFGARPGLIAGCTGVLAAVVGPYVRAEGVGFLFPIMMLAGLMIILFSLLKVAQLVRLIPVTVMMGFTNGLAIIIAEAQLHAFQVSDYWAEQLGGGYHQWIHEYEPAGGGLTLALMFVLMLVSLLIIHFLPKLTKAVPSPLVALAVTMGLEQIWRAASGGTVSTPLVGEVGPVQGGLPVPFFWSDAHPLPDLSWETFQKALFPAFTCAAVACVEDLMSIEVASDLTKTPTRNPNQHIFALGVANVVGGFFGTMGGGAMLGLTVINIRSGANGRFRISGMSAALFVLIITMGLPALVKLVPTAALVGVMVIVVVHTFTWSSLLIVGASLLPKQLRNMRYMSFLRRKIHRTDALVIVLVTVLTVVTHNLFIAVAVGILLSTFMFALQSSSKLRIEQELILGRDGTVVKKIYHVSGPLFFGSTVPLMHEVTPWKDPDDVEIHFQSSEIFDFSALDALNIVGEKYSILGKRLTLKNLCVTSTKLIDKADRLHRHFDYHRRSRSSAAAAAAAEGKLGPGDHQIITTTHEELFPIDSAFHLNMTRSASSV